MASGGSSPPLKQQKLDQEHSHKLVRDTVYKEKLTYLTPDLRNLIQMKPLRACLLKHKVVDELNIQEIEVSIQKE